MIDIHSHILPGIDDGASSVEESLAMINQLVEEGIEIALCTPHYNPGRETIMEFVEKRANAFSSLKNSEIILIPASETYLHPNLLRYPDIAELCVKNTRYLLLEMPFTNRWDQSLYSLLERLIATHNIIPIIAHIERYPATKMGSRQIKKLINIGCVIQLNTMSLQKKEIRRRALHLIKKGYIDVLGTDCHNMNNRPPVYATACEMIIEQLSEAVMNQLNENAIAIIHGKGLGRQRNLE